MALLWDLPCMGKLPGQGVGQFSEPCDAFTTRCVNPKPARLHGLVCRAATSVRLLLLNGLKRAEQEAIC